jgi:hypothetical protein
VVVAGSATCSASARKANRSRPRGCWWFVKWGSASLILFVGNLVAKLVLDLIGVAAGSTTSAVGKSLLLTFGLTLLGEAIVVWMRTGGATGLLNPPRATTAQPRQPSPDRFIDVTVPAEPSISYQVDDQANTPARSPRAVAPNEGPVWRSATLHDAIDWLRQQIDQPEEKLASKTALSRGLADAIIEHHRNHHHDHNHDHDHRHQRERS